MSHGLGALLHGDGILLSLRGSLCGAATSASAYNCCHASLPPPIVLSRADRAPLPFLCLQHDDEHKRAPARHRRQASLGRERPAGLAAGAASGPRAWGASSKGRPGSAGQGPHPAASAAADRAADQAAARAGPAAVATARGAKRMGTGDLRGRLTLEGKEYYLGRFPTALAAAQAEDYAALWRLGPTAAGELAKARAQCTCRAQPAVRVPCPDSFCCVNCGTFRWNAGRFAAELLCDVLFSPSLPLSPLPVEARNKLNLPLNQYGELPRSGCCPGAVTLPA